MKVSHTLDDEYDFFTIKVIDKVGVIAFKENPLLAGTDIARKELLFEYLDIISESKAIKVLLIVSSSKKIGSREYIDLCHRLLRPDLLATPLLRLYNAVNQLVLKIVDFNKIVIHANSGRVICLSMNIGLACDFRIIGDDTVFEKPYLDMGLFPIGGGAYFLSTLLGKSKAVELMLSDKVITAPDALRLGIVDKVVKSDKVFAEALEVARNFAKKPLLTSSSIKRVLNYSRNDLIACLECENKILEIAVMSSELGKRFEEKTCVPV